MSLLEDPSEHATALMGLLVDSVVDYAIFVLDSQGVVRTWNRGAERLKGFTRDEIVGRHVSVFYTEEDRADGVPAALMEHAAAAGRAEHHGWRVRKDRSRFWAHVTLTALRDDDGRLTGFAKITRDMTRERERESALRRALSQERAAAIETERLAEVRAGFVAAVVHDLAAPIMVVRTCAAMLSEPHVGLTPQRTVELTGAIRRNSTQLADLAEQLREYARVVHGHLELAPEPIDLAEELHTIVRDLGISFEDVRIAVDAPLGVVIEADRVALRRVVTNLVVNAVAFSPRPGEVSVRVEATDGRAVAIGVRDRGPGLSVADQARVFDGFWQGRALGRRSVGGAGLGLGLMIVREYTQAHGGRCWVDSAPGQGAAFWVTFAPDPVPVPARGAAEPALRAEAPAIQAH